MPKIKSPVTHFICNVTQTQSHVISHEVLQLFFQKASCDQMQTFFKLSTPQEQWGMFSSITHFASILCDIDDQEKQQTFLNLSLNSLVCCFRQAIWDCPGMPAIVTIDSLLESLSVKTRALITNTLVKNIERLEGSQIMPASFQWLILPSVIKSLAQLRNKRLDEALSDFCSHIKSLSPAMQKKLLHSLCFHHNELDLGVFVSFESLEKLTAIAAQISPTLLARIKEQFFSKNLDQLINVLSAPQSNNIIENFLCAKKYMPGQCWETLLSSCLYSPHILNQIIKSKSLPSLTILLKNHGYESILARIIQSLAVNNYALLRKGLSLQYHFSPEILQMLFQTKMRTDVLISVLNINNGPELSCFYHNAEELLQLSHLLILELNNQVRFKSWLSSHDFKVISTELKKVPTAQQLPLLIAWYQFIQKSMTRYEDEFFKHILSPGFLPTFFATTNPTSYLSPLFARGERLAQLLAPLFQEDQRSKLSSSINQELLYIGLRRFPSEPVLEEVLNSLSAKKRTQIFQTLAKYSSLLPAEAFHLSSDLHDYCQKHYQWHKNLSIFYIHGDYGQQLIKFKPSFDQALAWFHILPRTTFNSWTDWLLLDYSAEILAQMGNKDNPTDHRIISGFTARKTKDLAWVLQNTKNPSCMMELMIALGVGVKKYQKLIESVNPDLRHQIKVELLENKKILSGVSLMAEKDQAEWWRFLFLNHFSLFKHAVHAQIFPLPQLKRVFHSSSKDHLISLVTQNTSPESHVIPQLINWGICASSFSKLIPKMPGQEYANLITALLENHHDQGSQQCLNLLHSQLPAWVLSCHFHAAYPFLSAAHYHRLVSFMEKRCDLSGQKEYLKTFFKSAAMIADVFACTTVPALQSALFDSLVAHNGFWAKQMNLQPAHLEMIKLSLSAPQIDALNAIFHPSQENASTKQGELAQYFDSLVFTEIMDNLIGHQGVSSHEPSQSEAAPGSPLKRSRHS